MLLLDNSSRIRNPASTERCLAPRRLKLCSLNLCSLILYIGRHENGFTGFYPSAFRLLTQVADYPPPHGLAVGIIRYYPVRSTGYAHGATPSVRDCGIDTVLLCCY